MNSLSPSNNFYPRSPFYSVHKYPYESAEIPKVFGPSFLLFGKEIHRPYYARTTTTIAPIVFIQMSYRSHLLFYIKCSVNTMHGIWTRWEPQIFYGQRGKMLNVKLPQGCYTCFYSLLLMGIFVFVRALFLAVHALVFHRKIYPLAVSQGSGLELEYTTSVTVPPNGIKASLNVGRKTSLTFSISIKVVTLYLGLIFLTVHFKKFRNKV